MHRKIFEVSQATDDVGNEVWRIRVHKDLSPRQSWFLELRFPLFLVDGIVTPPLLTPKPAGQRQVCEVLARAILVCRRSPLVDGSEYPQLIKLVLSRPTICRTSYSSSRSSCPNGAQLRSQSRLLRSVLDSCRLDSFVSAAAGSAAGGGVGRGRLFRCRPFLLGAAERQQPQVTH